MNLPDIAALVPHSETMLLLDRVLAADADTLDAEVAIGPDTLFCADGAVGAWVGVEYMAQAVAAHAGHGAHQRGEPVRVGFLLGTRRYTCAQAAFPVGSVLRVHVERVLQGENGLGAYECRILAPDGAELAGATITVFQPDNVEEFLQRSSE
ncbi:3-hydroxylacyl-ACP dehydratase [Massilia sp. YIM B02763]|uniref:ApeP family dehydratase n=1 Tax=Massilia sp. YIM B02763 TaxID=3050130 RepID=UPI0025B67861|nr:3-hydroxylacyl-ACP dehydratase [Massilia sp. YIM B02763]MDN4051868.1 3-hydroxylacyl-ACP dehydratase [Massilia sp. YIM B02763]